MLTSVPLTAVRNFVALGDALATAGQPTEEQLALVAASGFEVIVNLGLSDPRYCLPDEAGSVAKLGLTYHHVPVDFLAPTGADLAAFERLMRECAGKRTFVHCALNYRVSCFVALFAEAHLGWSREQADAHVRRVWEPNEVWLAFMAKARAERASKASDADALGPSAIVVLKQP
jgi:protein tyrosine phosphatase (PTP) superfamily phosphohydrolase (DUF442 family)